MLQEAGCEVSLTGTCTSVPPAGSQVSCVTSAGVHCVPTIMRLLSSVSLFFSSMTPSSSHLLLSFYFSLEGKKKNTLWHYMWT